MKKILLVSISLLFYHSTFARDSTFFLLIQDRVAMLKSKGIDTIVTFGYNNTIDKKGFFILYQKNGLFIKRKTIYKLTKRNFKILAESEDSLQSYGTIFGFINENYDSITRQVNTIRNMESKLQIYNGKLVRSGNLDTYYMGISFFMSICIKDKQYFNNLPIGEHLSYINSYYNSQYYYWVLFSMLNNTKW
ncbi:MAG: hypothetical protein WC716_14835 [Chitinophagaceae bacterium]